MPPNLWGEVPPLAETFKQIEQLVAKRGGPARVASPPQDWAAIESRLGTTIPEDFRRFVDWHDPMIWSWFVHSERWQQGPHAEPAGVDDFPRTIDDGCWLRDVSKFEVVTARTSDGNAAFGVLFDCIDDYGWDHKVLDAEFLYFADTMTASMGYLVAVDDRFAPRGSVIATILDDPSIIVVGRNTSEWLAKLVALEGRDIACGGIHELGTEASSRLIEDYKVLNPDQGWY